jgi:Trypsin-like peptidase domain
MTNTIILEDAREYIFPIFSVEAEDNGVHLNSRVFLGTAFFVTKKGDAITASHVLPMPNELQSGRRLVAIIQCGGKEKVCWITRTAKFEAFDLALLHVNLDETKYLPLSSQEIMSGTDIQLIGIPSNDVNRSGKEMRILKGHITLAWKRLELNFPVPAGMSGSPVFAGSQVIGYATGLVRSEELEEATETIEEVTNTKEIVRITEIRRITSYGIAYAFNAHENIRDPVLENKTLIEFIASQNN